MVVESESLDRLLLVLLVVAALVFTAIIRFWGTWTLKPTIRRIPSVSSYAERANVGQCKYGKCMVYSARCTLEYCTACCMAYHATFPRPHTPPIHATPLTAAPVPGTGQYGRLYCPTIEARSHRICWLKIRHSGDCEFNQSRAHTDRAADCVSEQEKEDAVTTNRLGPYDRTRPPGVIGSPPRAALAVVATNLTPAKPVLGEMEETAEADWPSDVSNVVGSAWFEREKLLKHNLLQDELLKEGDA